MKAKKLNLKISLDKLTLNKETIVELSTNQMKHILGGNMLLSLGGGVGCPASGGTRCYSTDQGGCDDTFGCGVPTLSTACTQWC